MPHQKESGGGEGGRPQSGRERYNTKKMSQWENAATRIAKAGNVRRAMSDEVTRREQTRKDSSPLGREHAPGQPLGWARDPTSKHPAPRLGNR